MARITIVGSGIIGMSIAAVLYQTHDVTIIARNLPGDEANIEWASPWAGANFVAGGCSSNSERKMQMKAFSQLWEWSFTHPESSIRRITIEDIIDDDRTEEDIWWRKFMPEFRFIPQDQLQQGAKMGISYKTIVLTPAIFLPWLRQKLESAGVKFQRKQLGSLFEASILGHDVLVNATGIGSYDLTDVKDAQVEPVQGQTILVKSEYKKAFMRDDGKSYTYVIPRLDGTAILGGIRQPGVYNSEADENIAKDILRRIDINLPKHFSNKLSDYDIIRHNVGLRPARKTGIRIEKEETGAQKIVHAYGFSGGGYIFSFGAAYAARNLIEDLLLPSRASKL